MGPFYILLDEMGLDQMGLDKVGGPHYILGTSSLNQSVLPLHGLKLENLYFMYRFLGRVPPGRFWVQIQLQ